MEIFSLTFIYLFLPASIMLCGLLPAKARPYFLLLWSGLLYYWHEGAGLLLPVTVVLYHYALARLIGRAGDAPGLRRMLMLCSVSGSAALIVWYGVRYALYGTATPFGLQVLCLSAAGYVIDCYHGYAPAECNPVQFALMTSFFPKLYAGPLVHFSRLRYALRGPQMTLQGLGEGGQLFVRGLAKKVILGDTVILLLRELREIPVADTTPLGAWTLVVTMAFTAYFVLSGFCDMAKGLGTIFGFELPDNFLYPYRATSVNDFFARFNVTVNRFVRRYIYLNLGGAQGSVPSGIFNILLVTILMGLWFGINLNMMMWGIYFALFVILERYLLRRLLESVPTLFRWVYCMTVVLVSFAFFTGRSLGESFRYLGLLFGIGALPGMDNNPVLYLLASNYLALILCAVCALGAVGAVQKLFAKAAPRLCAGISAVFSAGLLLVTTAFLL